jgi:hypothetical protein
MSELVSIVIPTKLQPDISETFANRNFDELYCYCDRSYPNEKLWRTHFI